jgi:hypothetical protein
VPFAAWVAWGVAVYAGFELDAFATYLCPKEQMVSDMCTADWYETALMSIYCIGAALAAALVVLLCTLIAPAPRDRFARVTYFVGSLAAVAMAIETKMFLPLASALIAGALVWRWFDRRSLWPLSL